MCENALFFFSRVGPAGSAKKHDVINELVKKITDDKMVEGGQFRDLVMLMNVSNAFKIDSPELWA